MTECVIQSPANDTQEESDVEGYLSIKEVAEMLGMDASAIRHRIDRGNIPSAIKIGSHFRGQWLIPIEEAKKLRRAKSGRPPKK